MWLSIEMLLFFPNQFPISGRHAVCSLSDVYLVGPSCDNALFDKELFKF